jgi:hypothetical protein
MTALAKITAPYLVDDASGHALKLGVYPAGEALPVCCPVYIDTDGTLKKCVSTATYTAPANVSKFDGVVIQAAPTIGDVCTVWGIGTRLRVTNGTTVNAQNQIVIGSLVFVSATAGALDQAAVASADGTFPIAKGVSITDIRIIRPPL